MEQLGLGVASPHSDGRWISDSVSRVVELIQEYDPNLEVQWIPPEHRQEGDPAFRIMEKTKNGRMVIAFYVQDEKEFTPDILARIYRADAAKKGNILSEVDAKNKAYREAREKKHREEREEMIDFAYHMLRSPKTRYRHNGRVYE